MKDLFKIGIEIIRIYCSNPILAVVGSIAVVGAVIGIVKHRRRRSY